MKPSDIRIVCYCLDYMQLLDPQGEINKEVENSVRFDKNNNMQRILNGYNDQLYYQNINQEKRERFKDFIRQILQMYQMHKNVFTPYAPDVQYDNIKQCKNSINRGYFRSSSCK